MHDGPGETKARELDAAVGVIAQRLRFVILSEVEEPHEQRQRRAA